MNKMDVDCLFLKEKDLGQNKIFQTSYDPDFL